MAIQNFSTLVEREGMFLQSLRKGDLQGGAGDMPGPMKGIDVLKQQVALLLDPLASINPSDIHLVSCFRCSPSDLQVKRHSCCFQNPITH